ncbi:MAG: HD domain-containing protein [Candidatus Omnitrophica bacterium]|nr:HD domain-containing protein [Candidatus Omnitrophota bacterium]
MKRINFPFFKTLQARLTLALILAMLFVGTISNFFIYRYAFDAQFNDLREKLKTIAQTAALMIDAGTLKEIPLKRTGMETPQYKTVVAQLAAIKDANPQIKYIYIMAMTGREGILQFVSDPAKPTADDIRKGRTTYPGDTYDASGFPEMLRAFHGPSADKKLEIDKWGATLSGYAPIRDRKGRAVAILGVDMGAEEVYGAQVDVKRRAAFVLLMGLVISLLLASLISNRVNEPMRKLLEGTRRIAGGDLQYHVEAKGPDEVKELAVGFNRMAQSLHESREKLVDYFYSIMKSFVSIIEARDPYTRGHSDRVAKYAEKIALKMGLPQEKIEILKEAALLHDIGKLGVKEVILNKEEELTPEEWEEVRRHPAIGEEILRPVSLDREILEAVRGHHEHYDGTGYPDRLKGEQISILAAIVSVADVYDAMTSHRVYGKTLTREEAIEQLEKNRAVKFNPRVVDTFIRILREE